MASQERPVTGETGDDDGEMVADGFGSPVADRVHRLLAPVVATVGAQLVDVQWSGGTLRLAVEHPDKGQGGGDGDGITTDSLAEINRLVSPLLDQHDPVPGRYTLEVSSPGVERPLRRTEHFARAIGEVVIVKTVPGLEHRRLRGLLRSVEAGQLTIEVDEIDGVELDGPTSRQVALADIASARTHFDWGPTPKKGGKGPKGPKKNRSEQRPKQKQAKTTEEERGRT